MNEVHQIGVNQILAFLGIILAVWTFLYTTSLTIPKNLLEKHADLLLFAFNNKDKKSNNKDTDNSRQNEKFKAFKRRLKEESKDTFTPFFYDIDLAVNLFIYFLMAMFFILLLILLSILPLKRRLENIPFVLSVIIMWLYGTAVIYGLDKIAQLGEKKEWCVFGFFQFSSDNILAKGILVVAVVYCAILNVPVFFAFVNGGKSFLGWEVIMLFYFLGHMVLCVWPTIKYRPITKLVRLWEMRQEWMLSNDS